MTEQHDTEEPLDTGARMALGALQPMGNASYLASEMGGGGPAQPWRRNMPPAAFPCPLCAGTAMATSHPTYSGVLTLACDKGCQPAALTAACRARVAAAFVYRDDLLPLMSQAAVDAITTVLQTGEVTTATFDAFGASHSKRIVSGLHALRRGAASVTTYAVRNPTGGVVAVLARADYPAGAPRPKGFLPLHTVRTFDGRLETKIGLPARPWPLVGLDTMGAGKRVLVAEGEKARQAAEGIVPPTEWACLSSLAGADNAHCSDWSPVAGADVWIVPDNDEAGQKDFAPSVAAQALAAGARSARIVAPPPGAPPKWDLADPLPDGVTSDDLLRLLESAPVVEWEAVKHALRTERDASDWPPFRLPSGHLRGRKHVVEAVEEALGHMDPGCRRGPWLACLGAVEHALGTDGLAMAVAWSQRDNDKHGKFVPGEVERLWEAWAVEPHPAPMTVDALFWRAWRESKAASNDGEGWRPEREAQAEAALAAFEAGHRKFRSGDNIVVGKQTRAADGSYQIEYLREDTVRSEQKSNRVPTFGKSDASVFTLWENHQRVKPQKLVFRPGEAVAAEEFNMFQGLATKPRKGAGSYALYRQLIARIEAENEIADAFLWRLFAWRMQNLNKFVPCCVVLMGPQGSFKSTVSSVLYKLLAPYSISISNPENLAGNNNGALQDKLFVQAEEIELRTVEQNNRLKNYITSPAIDYIDKFKAQWSGDNRTFVVMTSNARLPVSVPADSRRFLLLRVRDVFEGDEAKRGELYGRMHAELEAGGYQALMYDLMHEDLTGFSPRAIPRTPLLRELAGADVESEPINSWWREHLERGAIRYGDEEVIAWTASHPKDRLYRQYVGWSEGNGPAARNAIMSKDAWARRLKELVGADIARRRMTDGQREQVFQFPEHEACCAVFEARFRTKLERPGGEAGGEGELAF